MAKDLLRSTTKAKQRAKQAKKPVKAKTPTAKKPKPLFPGKPLVDWKKANLIALVNGAPSPTAIAASNVRIYPNSIVSYDLPVRDGDGFTTLFTDTRGWLIQPVEA